MQNISSEFRALGTDVEINIIAGSDTNVVRVRKDIEGAKDIFFIKEKIFSRFDQDSEIAKLNRGLKRWKKASPDMLSLARRILHYNEISSGIFDPRIIEILEKIGYDEDFRKKDFSKMKNPPEFSALKTDLADELRVGEKAIFFSHRMDFSGIAKGYIVDQAAEFLKRRGWKNFLVNAGGDMRIFGRNKDGKKWRIAIEGVPEKKLMLEISDGGIATSGITRKKWSIGERKFHHLVNPQNPNNFSFELSTVSVIEKNAEEADGRAKVLILLGERAFAFARENKIAAVFLDQRGDVHLSSEARKYIFDKKNE